MERVQKARNDERAKLERLNKFDGSGWQGLFLFFFLFKGHRFPRRFTW
jgi:hypothetical protein